MSRLRDRAARMDGHMHRATSIALEHNLAANKRLRAERDEAVALLRDWRKLDRPDRYHMGTLNEATDAFLARLAPPATKEEG